MSIPDDMVRAAAQAGFRAAPALGRYHNRHMDVDAFTRAALATVATGYQTLLRAIEAEGYRVLTDLEGHHTLERKTLVHMGVDLAKGDMVTREYEVPVGESFTLVICGCGARLRPDHRDGEPCPVCNVPVKLQPGD